MENSSSSTHAAWLSLALAAMVGATVAAASSYLLHCRTVDRLQSQKMLDIGDQKRRRMNIRRRTNREPLQGGSSNSTVAPELMAHDNVKSVLNSSLPPRLPKADSTDSISSIPPGLPRVQTRKEGMIVLKNFKFHYIPSFLEFGRFFPCYATLLKSFFETCYASVWYSLMCVSVLTWHKVGTPKVATFAVEHSSYYY